MSFLVATNIVASRAPKRWPTGTPHARAKITSRMFGLTKRLIEAQAFTLQTNVWIMYPCLHGILILDCEDFQIEYLN